MHQLTSAAFAIGMLPLGACLPDRCACCHRRCPYRVEVVQALSRQGAFDLAAFVAQLPDDHPNLAVPFHLEDAACLLGYWSAVKAQSAWLVGLAVGEICRETPTKWVRAWPPPNRRSQSRLAALHCPFPR